MEENKVILVIMDGWGLGKVVESDAILAAETPFVDALYKKYPHTFLTTHGEQVGLPHGQMGNSEVGHLNIGAGRIVYQELERINVAIREGTFQQNVELLATIAYAKTNNKFIHLCGLVSDGGVHSHINHLKALLDVCFEHEMTKVRVHAFTDGRDTDPKSALLFLQDLQDHTNKTTGAIATVTGRYYAMDRDKRWERIKIAYDAMVHGSGYHSPNIIEAIKESYQQNITDEFIKPIINAAVSNTALKDGDVMICFNYRTDRCREITEVLTQKDMPDFNMHTLPLYYCTMTPYDHSYKNIHAFFLKDDLTNTLGEVLSKNNRQQLRIAETEKYPHVSFFFSGGRENPFAGEERKMIPSPKVATYDLQPAMSAIELTETVNKALQTKQFDFICLNFANADMVGHTGIWSAIVTAVETVDNCVQKVVTAALENNYIVFLTADHGNADFAVNLDGTPNTAHTTNLVPLFIISKIFSGPLHPGKLGDIAPTILSLMQLPIPLEMTGKILI
ncbi:MAG: 2,3-bisphosphoglycerate-independent phosphoglycerate mutase [Ferruginibacter sp.]